MKQHKIREANASDCEAIFQLINELAIFEKEPEAVKVTPEELRRDGFGEKPLFKAIVAELDNEVVGFALYYIRYSTWKGKCIYLEDFVVNDKFRSQGIGKDLFEHLLGIAKEMGVRLMTWQVLDWNKDAIRFYDRYNSTYEAQWLNAKIEF